MTKRRTKKQKIKAKYQFILKQKATTTSSTQVDLPEAKNTASEAVVKGQFKKRLSFVPKKQLKSKNADFVGKDSNLALIRQDIIKSLILASLVIGLELVIYLWWSR